MDSTEIYNALAEICPNLGDENCLRITDFCEDIYRDGFCNGFIEGRDEGYNDGYAEGLYDAKLEEE